MASCCIAANNALPERAAPQFHYNYLEPVLSPQAPTPPSAVSLSCQLCQKKFSSESAWTDHLNSVKHQKEVKQANSQAHSQKDSQPTARAAVSEALDWIQQAKLAEAKTPNKASKLYLDAAKVLSQNHYINAASGAFHSLSALQSKGALGIKVHLYLGRLLRHFDPQHSVVHFRIALEELTSTEIASVPSHHVFIRNCTKHINVETIGNIREVANEVGVAMSAVDPKLAAMGWIVYAMCAQVEGNQQEKVIAYQKAAAIYFSVGMTPDGIDSLIHAEDDATIDEALANAIFISDFVRIRRIINIIDSHYSNHSSPCRQALVELAKCFVELDSKQIDVVLCEWDYLLIGNKHLLDVVDAVRAYMTRN